MYVLCFLMALFIKTPVHYVNSPVISGIYSAVGTTYLRDHLNSYFLVIYFTIFKYSRKNMPFKSKTSLLKVIFGYGKEIILMYHL